MTKKELDTVLKVLEKIKNPDSYVLEAVYIIKKNIERYNKMRGQLRDQWNGYEYPY
jgi:hypothetical protein